MQVMLSAESIIFFSIVTIVIGEYAWGGMSFRACNPKLPPNA